MLPQKETVSVHSGCPGSRQVDFGKNTQSATSEHMVSGQSELQQWPVQLHLISPMASYFKGADLLVASDCSAFAVGDFHNRYLKGKRLVIACPKLDSNKESYIDKFVSLINDAKVNTITVLLMEVPCCGGLIVMIQEASRRANRKVPVKSITVSLRGDVISEEWI